MFIITTKSLTNDINNNISPSKYEHLDKHVWNAVKFEYYKRNKKVLILYYYSEKNMTQEEISSILGISQSSVNRYLNRR